MLSGIKRSSLLEGCSAPLGAHWDGEGVNFALFSANAERVELCLYDGSGTHETARHVLPSWNNQIWHGYLPGVGPGTVYAYRVYGPYQPHLGHRFNPHKLVLDPYCRQLTGKFIWSDLHHGFDVKHTGDDEIADQRDNQHLMPKCVVTSRLPLAGVKKPRIPMAKTVLYEAHLKGFTVSHPGLPESIRGKFAGMAHKDIVGYIKSLGITSVELLPIQSFVSESFLINKNLQNYWGYNPLCFFAPHQAYQHSDSLLELRQLVDTYHEAGLEIIMDVVFNHTAEGGRLGPTLSLRGIDNSAYYRLQSEDRSFYINDTGCGNTLNMSHPRVIQLVMDCLRYWADEIQVDGFRFDLAPVLGRETHGYDQGSGFFDALQQDPTLAGIKLIAEPWDIGPGGYQLGNFPPGWSEWNDRFRDASRRFWRADPGMLPEFARRLHGSSDIFEHSGRRPSSSINYICSHDGFTLNDLVSYRERHNLNNGEKNLDGHRENFSDNFGMEGPASDTTVNVIRLRQQRNFLTTLMLSQGVPMLQAGDEFCRTLHGNNNAYCQDNELNWINWEHIPERGINQRQFTKMLIALRSRFHFLFPDKYIHDTMQQAEHTIEWFNNSGETMQPAHWQEHHSKTLGYMISGTEPGQNCRTRLLIVFHAGRDAASFKLPRFENINNWQILLDTASFSGQPDPDNCHVAERLNLFSCSSVVLLATTSSGNQSNTGIDTNAV